MKPAPFKYYDPESLTEALDLMAEYGDDAKVMAGGQSLIPLLNFRLAQPGVIVDLNRISNMDQISIDAGVLKVGALVRQSALEHSTTAIDAVSLLGQALKFVAHPQIRNRGTIGGSAAHADPAAELPAAFKALKAEFTIESRNGHRRLDANQFFVSHLTTALEDEEILTGIEIPVPSETSRSGFVEYSRRHGDFAFGGAAAQLDFDRDGRCCSAQIVLLAASDVPVRAKSAEELIVGSKIDAVLAGEAGSAAVADIDPSAVGNDDVSSHRRAVIRAAVEAAITSATGEKEEL